MFVSGKGPLPVNGSPPRGRLGAEFTTKQGYEFARSTGFEEHPQVLNGCSDLMVEVFGERGVHARSVLGAVSVRANLPVIVESQFEVS